MSIAGVKRPQMRRRLLDWLLLPTRDNLVITWREGFEVVLYTNTEIPLGVKDRLRIMVTGRLRLELVTNCEHTPGHVESESSVSAA